MEVKPGYKQTEVGVIPEEWEVPYLRQHLLQDATYGVVKAGAFQRSGIPMLRSGEIKNGAIIEDHPLITPEKSQEYSRTILKKNDVVIALVGYPGETAVIPERLVGANISRAVGLLRPASNLRPEFLACYLNSPNGRKEFLRPSAGSAQIVVNLGALNKLRLPVPLLPEQRAIATALSDVDGLLGGLDRLIAKKRDLKQAAMQQLLTGRTRLPGFHGEWRMTRLQDMVTADKFAIVDGPFGSQLTVDEYVESGVPIIEMEHLIDGVVTQQIERYITRKKFDELKRSAVYPGDILISKTGSLGKLGIIPDSIERGLITSRLAKITLNRARADRYFVFQHLLKHRRDGYWEKVSQGGTMQILGIGMLQNTPIPDISLPEQTAIAEVLTEMDGELAGLEQRREKTRALKQAMMQELLTGRTRLISSKEAHA